MSVLIAAVAALLLVPAASAFAAVGTMTVNIEGSGNGEVSSVGGVYEYNEETEEEEFTGRFEGNPPIECSYTGETETQSGVCADNMSEYFGFFEGTSLHQIAAPGSEFVAWIVEGEGSGGGCSGTEFQCSRGGPFGSGPKATVTAIFNLAAPKFTLTVTPEGTGEGTVTSTPPGINCGSECEAEFEEGEEVELSQSAETGSEFIEWGGACSGSGACEVTMDEAKEVTATFDLEPTPEFELEINTNGTGEGEVECEVESGPAEPCEAEYEEGTEVALVPEAETGSEFTEWSGDCTGSGPCELTMDEDHSVTATFDEEEEPEPEPEEFALTIAKAGTGSGSVTCDAGACASEYEEGTELTLAATPASGSTFSGWSGGGCSGTASCEVTIEEDTAVTATFTANPKPEETCATNASLCPPPPPPAVEEGKAKAAATATVKGGKAQVKLTCTGGPCRGTLKLTAKVKQGTKSKNKVIGKASFNIASGAAKALKVKLSGPAKQMLAKGKALKAKASGPGVKGGAVKLKPQKKKK